MRDGLTELLPRLWRFAVILSGSRVEADELVQATCLRALERADQFAPGTALDRWTFAIMASIWKNQLRSAAVRRGAGLVPADDALLVDSGADVEQAVTGRQVLAAAGRLPEHQRTALFLVYVEGYSYREAAHAIEVPMETLRSRLAAARTALADALGSGGGDG